jgi:hypothetical protein
MATPYGRGEPSASDVGVAPACRVTNVDHSPVPAAHRDAPSNGAASSSRGCPRPHPALSDIECGCVLEALNSELFASCSTLQTYAALLGEGIYSGSVRAMYRLLAGAGRT